MSDTPTPPGKLETFFLRFGTAGALLAMVARGKRWWMLPLVGVFLLVAIVLLVLQSIQYVAPFVYMVF